MVSVHRLALIVCAVVPWMARQDAQPSPPTVESLLTSAEAAYAKIDSFAATGWIENEVRDDDGSAHLGPFGHQELDLFFQKPDTLMIMLVLPGGDGSYPTSFMLNAHGGEAAYTSSAWPATIEQNSLKNAVAGGPAGISSSGTGLIAGLLLPDAVSKFRIRDITERQLVGEETVRGVKCWKITGRFGGGRQAAVSLWLEHSTHLVWQVTLERASGALGGGTLGFESVRQRSDGDSAMQSVIHGVDR